MDTPAEVGTSPKLKKHQVDRAEVPPSLSEHTPSVATSIDSAVGSPPLPLSAAGTAGCGALSLCTSHGAESAFQDLFPPLNQSGSSHSRADEGSQRDGERVETIFDGDDSNCSYTNSNSNGTPARSFSLLAEGEDILQDVFAFAEKSLLIGEKMEGGEFEGVENSKKRPELWQQEEQMEEHERESNGAPHTNSGCHQRVSSDSRTNELSGFGGRCVHTNQTHRGLPGHSHGVWDSPSCRTLSGGSHTPPPSNALVHSTQTTLGGDGCTGRTQKADVQLTCELCGTSASLTSSVAVRACSSSCARRVKEELERLRSDYAKLQERYTQALERSLLLSSDRNETLKMLVQQKQQSPEGKSPGASFEAEAEKEQEREAREGSEGHNHDGRLLNREDHSPPPGFEGTPCERPHNRHAHSSLRGMPLSPHHCRSSAPHLFNSRDREGNMFSSTDRDRDRDPRGFGYHEHNRTMGGGMRAPPSQFSPPPHGNAMDFRRDAQADFDPHMTHPFPPHGEEEMRSMHQGGPPMNPYHRGSPPHFHHPHARERGGQLPEGPPGFGHGLGGQRDPRDFHCREGLPPSPHFADRDREREGDREKGSPRIPRDRERRQPITQGGIDGPVGWLTPKTLLPDPSRYRTCTTPCTSGVGDHRKCKWRNSCFYAHYLLELQHFETFRTRPCASFVQAGRCEFGSTCVFIHSHEPASLDCQEITKKQAAVCRELCGEPVEEEGGEGEEKEGEQAQRKERQENEVGVFGGARTGSSGLVAGGVFRKARGARIFREKKKVVEEEVEGEKEKESEESGTEEERVSSEEKRKSLGAAEQEDIPVAGGEEETDNKGKK